LRARERMPPHAIWRGRRPHPYVGREGEPWEPGRILREDKERVPGRLPAHRQDLLYLVLGDPAPAKVAHGVEKNAGRPATPQRFAQPLRVKRVHRKALRIGRLRHPALRGSLGIAPRHTAVWHGPGTAMQTPTDRIPRKALGKSAIRTWQPRPLDATR